MKEQFDVVINGENKTVVVTLPNSKIDAEANMYASQIFARLIKKEDEDGNPAFLLRAKLNEFLQKIGVWSEEDIKRIAKLTQEIKSYEDKLEKGGIKKSEGRDIAIALRKNRLEFIRFLTKRNEYDEYTVEYFAENGRFNFLVTKCVTYDNGDPIFFSVEDYETNDELQKVLAAPIKKLASMTSSYDENYIHNLIEHKFLKKYNYCNNDYDLVDSEGRRVNEKGELIDENGQVIESEKAVHDVGDFLEE